MNRSGSPPRTNRCLFGLFVLVAIVLLAATPAAAVLHAEQPQPSSIGTTDAPELSQTASPGQYYLSQGLSLASIFPFATDREVPQRTEQEVIGVGDEQADALFDALGSSTARNVLSQLLEEPQTASELADGADTSLQNIHYHIEKLREANAIEEIDTEYSARGREMSVYTATSHPQILVYDLK
ncbi:helix-turn-helix transcriptional regulator [Halonotius sp. F2-221B]|uniref:helix-turn-helix domain-containing protein n=1 Tax=Halonotius sp. F2-221B TaxID=2731620 RepID=UPI00398AE681